MPRPARIADAAEAALVLAAPIRELSHRDHYGDPAIVARWTSSKTPARLRRRVAAGPLALTMALRSGRLIGVGATLDRDEVALMDVAPGARYSGVLDALLTARAAWLRAGWSARLHLTSTLAARGFYIASGWRDSGTPVEGHGLWPGFRRSGTPPDPPPGP